MDNTGDVEVIYPEPMQELDENVHYNNLDLVKMINTLIRKLK